MKKLFLVLLILTVFTAGLPLTGMAASSVYTYKSDGSGGIVITSCSKAAKGSLTIPASIDKKTVTGIAAGAFSDCYYVTGVKLPAKAKSVTADAFTDCPFLTSIAVSSGNTVFASKSGVLFSKSMKTLVRCPEGKKGAFTIPSGVSVIGAFAFKNCTEITSLTIPSGVKTISAYAFASLGIKTVSLPRSVSSIAVSAFDDCFTLKSISVNGKNTAYRGIDGVLYSKGKNVIVRCPEGKTGKYTIVSGVRTVGASAFLNCTYIPTVVIPNSVTKIADYAFSGAGITSVTIPSGVTAIAAKAFENCFNLKTFAVNSANTVYSARDGMLYSKYKKVFVRCPAGKSSSYTVLSGVTKIEKNAFSGCVFISKVTLPTSVTTIADEAFRFSGIKSFAVPSGVTAIGAGAFGDCYGLVSFSVAKENTKFTAISGVLFSKDKKTLAAYPTGKRSASYAIPSGTVNIADMAFMNNASLSGLTIPKSVNKIGASAFYGCIALKKVTVPDTVTAIGSHAFGYQSGNYGDVLLAGFVITCKKDSAAHKYAVANKITCVI